MRKVEPVAKNKVDVEIMTGNYLYIYCLEETGRDWCLQNLPKYGRVLDMNREVKRKLSLLVSPLYNISDVIQYIKDTLNDNRTVASPEWIEAHRVGGDTGRSEIDWS